MSDHLECQVLLAAALVVARSRDVGLDLVLGHRVLEKGLVEKEGRKRTTLLKEKEKKKGEMKQEVFFFFDFPEHKPKKSMGDAIKTCRLLAGPAALAAQLSLALVVLAVLLLRRARENPKRERSVFLFDVSKQFVSAGAAHLSGLAFSLLVAAAAAGGGGGGGSSSAERRRQRQQQPSECGWYLVLFSVDTVIGSALAILLHRGAVAAAARVAERTTKREQPRTRLSPPPPPTASSPPSPPKPGPAPLAARSAAAAVARCGSYGSPPSVDVFLPQLVEWTLAVVLARLCCGLSVLALSGGALSAAAAGVDALFPPEGRPSLELFSVMLAGPLLMNAGQALVQDGVLRAKRARAGAGTTREAAGAAAQANGNNGEGEGAELLSSPSSSSVSPFSHHP